jgi:cobalt-zinc-cadmium efflux system membrane fusion protein
MLNMKRFVWLYMFSVFFVLAGIMTPITGCVQKESEKKDKTASIEKANEDRKEKEAPDIVMMSPEKQKASGIELQKATFASVSAPLSATAVVEINLDRSAKMSPRVTGKVVRIVASQGDKVQAGQPLAYLDSVETDQMQADYLKAQSRLDLARSDLRREEALFEKKISPEKDVIKAKQGVRAAEADLNLAKERFRLAGMDVTQPVPPESGRNYPLVAITSPISGTVVERSVSQGEVAGPEKILFFVADLSSLWIGINLYEKDIAQLGIGVDADISVDAIPGTVFKGRISHIGDVVDEKTRTVKARVTIVNSNGLLKPGMFASVKIDNPKGLRDKLLVIPESSILSEGDSRYVFVTSEDGRFVKRAVIIGRTFGSKIEISGGLKEGESVVTSGAFILKSELKKKELEAD